MKPQVKKIIQLTAIFFVLVMLVDNCQHDLNQHNFIADASKTSQIINTNRLRRPNIQRASEFKRYPDLAKEKAVKLVVISRLHRVYVLSGRRVIYLMHAQVNVPAKHFKSQGKSGQLLGYTDGNQTITSRNWVEFGHHCYLTSPVNVNQQSVATNWLNSTIKFPNSILVSQPDAHWLQGLPKNTTIIVR